MKVVLLAILATAAFTRSQVPPQDEKISTDVTRVNFYLWTPEFGSNNPLKFDIHASALDLLRHKFDPTRPTKVLSHGWNSDGLGFSTPFVEAYFSHQNLPYNIIGINWQPLATWDNYFTAAKNAVRVGQFAGEHLGRILLQELKQQTHQIHAIGHSLGGHLVGHFGRKIQSTYWQGKIARISSLDPAGPWFDVAPQENRVNKNDAELVDVIHTNSGSLLNLCLSYPGALGHIDFYPNGGSHQAGCNDVCLASSCSESNLIDLFNGACSHARVKDLYVESIYHAPHYDVFLSQRCDSWHHFETDSCDDRPVEMGEGLTSSLYLSGRNLEDLSGKYYLETNSQSPFSGIQ